MKKSNTIFGVSTNDIVEQIEEESSKENKIATVESQKQKTKTLLKKSKVIGHNTKNK